MQLSTFVFTAYNFLYFSSFHIPFNNINKKCLLSNVLVSVDDVKYISTNEKISTTNRGTASSPTTTEELKS
ncbi:hypothetical protein T4D_17014 [Trichinella pseudospiralis]|uniref:Uncharacterized protein n=1 Tax=Trichinella pseudospiralis TaxID=6337 RepID=A0A0V1F500_TRIPS|nr:hypothetical protein T4D_17014 [Trichinella pseudospiralis]